MGRCGKVGSWIHKVSSVAGVAIWNVVDFVAEIAVKTQGWIPARRNAVDGETAQ